MSLWTWRQVYRSSRINLVGAWAVKGIQLARGADTDHGPWAAVYVALFGLFLLCGHALRNAERQELASSTDGSELT